MMTGRGEDGEDAGSAVVDVARIGGGAERVGGPPAFGAGLPVRRLVRVEARTTRGDQVGEAVVEEAVRLHGPGLRGPGRRGATRLRGASAQRLANLVEVGTPGG